jgi:hypothetical protein
MQSRDVDLYYSQRYATLQADSFMGISDKLVIKKQVRATE